MATIPQGRGIDRSSYEPAYVQLVNILRGAIASGQYQAGDQLPTESELCAAYDVSPMTVRRAIGMLLDQGAVSTTRGRGTFVQPLRLATATFDLSEFHDILAEPGVTAKVVEARVLPAGPRAAANLGVAGRHARRLHPPHPAARRRAAHLPPRVADLRPHAADDRVRARRHRPARHVRGRRRQRPQARRAHPARLGAHRGRGRPPRPAAPGSAAWVLEHIFYGYDEKPISWGCFICRGDLFSFRASVGAPAPEGDAGARRNRR